VPARACWSGSPSGRWTAPERGVPLRTGPIEAGPCCACRGRWRGSGVEDLRGGYRLPALTHGRPRAAAGWPLRLLRASRGWIE
jgi:hypothetical protein